MAESIVTIKTRQKMVRARAGIGSIPKIVGMAFGDGAQKGTGEILPPHINDNALRNEILRKKLNNQEEISATTFRYYCTLERTELGGKNINEVALYDADGDLVAIKSFANKGKDIDMEMTFQIDDIF